MNEKNESEGLAERLRLLYRAHDCENELPTHDDLVAKLDKITPEVREAIELGFFNGVYFISYREAEKMAEEGAELIEYFLTLLSVSFVNPLFHATCKPFFPLFQGILPFLV